MNGRQKRVLKLAGGVTMEVVTTAGHESDGLDILFENYYPARPEQWQRDVRLHFGPADAVLIAQMLGELVEGTWPETKATVERYHRMWLTPPGNSP